MKKLIGFNLIQSVVWFIIVIIITSKTKDYEHIYSNGVILTSLTGTLSLGVYCLLK